LVRESGWTEHKYKKDVPRARETLLAAATWSNVHRRSRPYWIPYCCSVRTTEGSVRRYSWRLLRLI
jgi:hypothetical protein